MGKYNIVKDKYTKVRGGNSKFLTISCGVCNKEMFLYQKDGHGRLLRLYLDKIKAPEKAVAEFQKIYKKNEMGTLKCPKCKTVLAVPMVYEKEDRLAFRIIGPVKSELNKEGEFPTQEYIQNNN